MSRSGRSPNVVRELAQKIGHVARTEAHNNGTHVERWRVRQASPLLIEEVEGDLVLEDGDPDFTIGDTLRQHIASYGLKADDQVLVVHSGAEWHAFDAASVAVVKPALEGPPGPIGPTGPERAAPALVSSLPGSPVDGQEVSYQNEAMAAAGVVWRLRYRAASASAYKWEYVGGSDYYQFTDPGAEVTHTEAFTNPVAVVGAPTFTTPLAGDWKVDVAAYGVVITDGFIERIVGGTATQVTSGNVAGVVLGTTAGHVTEGGMTNPGRLLGVAAGAVLALRSMGSIGKVRLYGTTLIVRPIRVG